MKGSLSFQFVLKEDLNKIVVRNKSKGRAEAPLSSSFVVPYACVRQGRGGSQVLWRISLVAPLAFIFISSFQEALIFCSRQKKHAI
jgi:hypothetical protein